MSERIAGPAPLSFLGAMALAVGLGAAWIGLEVATTLATGRALVPAQTLERMLALLPWQLGLFAGIGLGLALVAGRFGVDRHVGGWLVVVAGSFLFLGEPLSEGLLRRYGPSAVALGLVCLAVSLVVIAAASLAIGRRLPARLARGFVPATWLGWCLFFVLWMQHSLANIRIWEPGFEVLTMNLRPAHFGAGAAALGLAWLAAALATRARGRALLALSLLAPYASTVGAAGRPDVLIVLIDTLRFDHIGANVGEPGTTPALDALAAESVLFSNAYSPGNYTKLAVPGIHTSLSYRVVRHPLPDEATTLAERFRESGYGTYGISANPYVSRNSGYGQGFDVFLDPTAVNQFLVEGLLEAAGVALPGPSYRLGVVTSALYYEPADAIRRRAIEFFRKGPGPSFVYVQSMDPHGPYLPPHRYLEDDYDSGDFASYFQYDALRGQGKFAEPTHQPALVNLRQRYRAEVRFTDEEIGKLVAGLRELDEWDETLVLLLSDHGETFGEKDWFGHSGPHLSRTLVHVPFMIKPPKSWQIAPRVEDAAVSTYDIFPTLMSLLGLDAPAPAFGRDLSRLLREGGVEADRDRTVVSFALGPGRDLYTAVRGPWKLDFDIDRPSGAVLASALFDLRNDPGELHDVAGEHPNVVADLGEAIWAWRAREDRTAYDSRPVELDPLERERLRRLGYIE